MIWEQESRVEVGAGKEKKARRKGAADENSVPKTVRMKS